MGTQLSLQLDFVCSGLFSFVQSLRREYLFAKRTTRQFCPAVVPGSRAEQPAPRSLRRGSGMQDKQAVSAERA